ncbi:MAG: FAD-dependent monooxygenase [Acidobacteria bacterium]|nr:FAD-dependent monooxygenase [Acidobacteriota bacterium]
MCDVLIVGAGPAGAVAGIVLARAGARVRLIDRAVFPRDKLCGDTLNPGTLAHLARLGLAREIEQRGLRIDGMCVTGERGDSITGRYPGGLTGRAIVRRDLDALLLQYAAAAGCEIETRCVVRRPVVVESGGARRVTGVVVGGAGGEREITAPVTIAADGRRSTIAFALGLARHPAHPRRWAVGAYYAGFLPRQNAETSGGSERTRPTSADVFGEMHIRSGRYIGVAPVPGGLTNVCLVIPSRAGDEVFGDPAALLARELARDPLLRDRSAGARLATAPVVLGPLAVDVDPAAIDGLLLAGDAAGFIDPMTGDGLRFAVRGGELAAHAALDAVEHGWNGIAERLASDRRREFGGKWRFNRVLRAVVASPRALGVVAQGARVAPGVLRAVIARAGDCGAAL